jgi:hypothetical protein
MRASSWDRTGGNEDWWNLPEGETKTIADLEGPGLINHIWFTFNSKDPYYMRKILIRAYWDDETEPSIDSPVGDFFGIGHCKVHPFQSLPFNMTGSTEQFTAMNCFFAMPFRNKARLDIVNEAVGDGTLIYFYVDYEKYNEPLADDILYFHAKWRRENPTDGWMPKVPDRPDPEHYKKVIARKQLTDEGNYLVLDAEGQGHYVGCNLSVHNLQGGWWGEGDDMIWVDGYKWPPDLHGTGSEDYLNQAWGMQPNAFMHNGSSIFEHNTNGFQTSYVHHIENPVRFQKEIKVTIEHGHGNHLSNEMASVAYWYQDEPHKPFGIVPVAQRKPVLRAEDGTWIVEESSKTPPVTLEINDEMRKMLEQWKAKKAGK